MTRRNGEHGGVLGAALVVASALLLTACGGSEPAAEGRSLVLITMDTTRTDHLGAFGRTDSPTPTIDALAADGVRFTRAYAPMGQTLPSHATMFTGQGPRSHGALENFYPLPEGAHTLAERLADRGYETVGVIGALVLAEDSGIAQGFGVWDQPSGQWKTDQGHPPERPAAQVTDGALAWALRRESDGPYFLWVHYYDPHGPYEPPGHFRPSISREAVSTMVTEASMQGAFSQADAPLTKIAETWFNYAAELEYTDAQVGRLLEGLRARGMLDDAVVAVASDHGEGLYEHGHKGHGVNLFEELMHVPLIVTAPDGELSGTVVDQPVQLQDLLPTLLTAVGQQAPEDVEGHDLWSAAREGRAPPRQPIFIERPHYNEQRLDKHNPRGRPREHEHGVVVAVIADGHKLVRQVDGSVQLFDLATDPAERDDLSGLDPERTTLLGGLLDDYERRFQVAEPGSGESVSPERAESLNQLGYGGGEGR